MVIISKNFELKCDIHTAIRADGVVNNATGRMDLIERIKDYVMIAAKE